MSYITTFHNGQACFTHLSNVSMKCNVAYASNHKSFNDMLFAQPTWVFGAILLQHIGLWQSFVSSEGSFSGNMVVHRTADCWVVWSRPLIKAVIHSFIASGSHWHDLTILHDDVIKWRHFSALLALCAGNSLVIVEFPAQRPVTGSFDVFFHLRLNKWLSKQSWGWWWDAIALIVTSL